MIVYFNKLSKFCVICGKNCETSFTRYYRTETALRKYFKIPDLYIYYCSLKCQDTIIRITFDLIDRIARRTGWEKL